MQISQIKQIANGWINLILNELELLPEDLKKEAEKRIEICHECPLRKDNRCDPEKEGEAVTTFFYKATGERRVQGINYKGCGCNLAAKTVCKDCQCPLGKWLEYDNRNNQDM